MSDYPKRLRNMAEFSPEAQTVTKIIPAGAAFLRDTARYIETLERIINRHCDDAAVALAARPSGRTRLDDVR